MCLIHLIYNLNLSFHKVLTFPENSAASYSSCLPLAYSLSIPSTWILSRNFIKLLEFVSKTSSKEASAAMLEIVDENSIRCFFFTIRYFVEFIQKILENILKVQRAINNLNDCGFPFTLPPSKPLGRIVLINESQLHMSLCFYEILKEWR